MSSGALDYMAHFAIASSVSFNFLVFLFQKHAVHMPGPRYQQDPYFQQLVTMHRGMWPEKEKTTECQTGFASSQTTARPLALNSFSV